MNQLGTLLETRKFCPACQAPLTPGSPKCAACGQVAGIVPFNAARCPHCGVDAQVEPSPRSRCRVCGGDRIFVADPSIPRSGRESPLLLRAERARKQRWLWLAATLGAAGLSLFLSLFTIFAALVTKTGAFALVGSLLAVPPFGLAFWAGQRVKRAARDRAEARRQALLVVAADVVRARGRAIRPEELATLLHLPLERTELLLAELDLEEGTSRDAAQLGERARIAPADMAAWAQPPSADAQAPDQISLPSHPTVDARSELASVLERQSKPPQRN